MLEPSFRLSRESILVLFSSEVTVPARFGWKIRKKPHMNAWCWSDLRSRRRSSQFMSTSICPDSGMLFFKVRFCFNPTPDIISLYVWKWWNTIYLIYRLSILKRNHNLVIFENRFSISICHGILSEQLFHCTCNFLWHQRKSKFLDCLLFRAYWVQWQWDIWDYLRIKSEKMWMYLKIAQGSRCLKLALLLSLWTKVIVRVHEDHFAHWANEHFRSVLSSARSALSIKIWQDEAMNGPWLLVVSYCELQ